MPMFRCDTCGCLDNSAYGLFHSRNDPIWPEEQRGKKLCSECAPSRYPSGNPTKYQGWRDTEPKRSAVGWFVTEDEFAWESVGDIPKHLRIIGVYDDNGEIVSMEA